MTNPPTALSLALREGWYALLFVLALWLGMAWLLAGVGATDAEWITALVLVLLFEVEVMP